MTPLVLAGIAAWGGGSRAAILALLVAPGLLGALAFRERRRDAG